MGADTLPFSSYDISLSPFSWALLYYTNSIRYLYTIMINHHDFTHFLSLRIYIMYVDYLCVRCIDYAVRNTSTHSLYAVFFCEVCLHGVTCSTTHKLRRD